LGLNETAQRWGRARVVTVAMSAAAVLSLLRQPFQPMSRSGCAGRSTIVRGAMN
jgi:hypothetical protein